jgi:hypothetical protein
MLTNAASILAHQDNTHAIGIDWANPFAAAN